MNSLNDELGRKAGDVSLGLGSESLVDRDQRVPGGLGGKLDRAPLHAHDGHKDTGHLARSPLVNGRPQATAVNRCRLQECEETPMMLVTLNRKLAFEMMPAGLRERRRRSGVDRTCSPNACADHTERGFSAQKL
jgi:hypothetical protein